MRRRLLSWTSIFALATVMAGGCDGGTPEPNRRTPRVVDTTSELVVMDEGDSAKTRSNEELIGAWTPPAKAEVVRPPPALPRRRPAVAQEPPPAPAPEVIEPRVDAEPPPPVAAPEVERPAEANLPTVPRPRDDPGWYAPPPRGTHTTAVNVALAVGAISAGMATTAAASSDGTPGDRAVVLTALGIGAASFGTALVLHLTEPAAKPKPGANVTLGPGMIGMRGTF